MNSVASISSLILQQSPVILALVIFVTASLTFLAYLSYTPKVDKRAPKFTSDKSPFIGSWGFYSRRWSFWKNSAARSKTGHFSFWLGKNHVVGVTGEAARKSFLDHKHLDRVAAAPLHGVGPEIVPPIHPIFQMNFDKGHSYFQRRVLDLVQSENLSKHLPRITKDARTVFEAMSKAASDITNPIEDCYRLVLVQSCRVVCTDEISDTPELINTYLMYTKMLQHCSSGHTVAVPWLPSWSHWKRKYCRQGLNNLVTPIVERRMRKDAPRIDDTLGTLIANGDSKDYMVTFFISILFISVANAGKLAGGLLNMMANHPDWQDQIYKEIKTAVAAHATNKDAPLVDQLDTLSLEAWESSFPFLELCFREAIRMHVAFPMIRQNLGPAPIPIPNTNEVIPRGSYVAYNTGDVHFDEKLYPNPRKLDSMRFSEGRDEYKKESYAFLGWGNGRHRCVGQRWAKLQQNIILAYAIAMFQWTACDENGDPIPLRDLQTNFDKHGNSLAKGIYLKHALREKI